MRPWHLIADKQMTTRAAGIDIGINRASAREGGRTLQRDRFLPVSTTEG